MGDNNQTALDLMAAATLDEKRAAMAQQQEQLNAKVQQLQHHLGIISAALSVLGVRVFTFLALIGGLVMFGYAVWEPEWTRTMAAAAYAVIIFLPTLYWTRGKLQGE